MNYKGMCREAVVA